MRTISSAGSILAILFSCCSQFITSADAADALPDQRPFLIIETGMHTAPIRRIAVDARCSLILTAGGDKTARLWELRGDSSAPRLMRTLRVPIGSGDSGKIFSAALSSDGTRIAVGGSDARFASEGYHQIYIFDAITGEILKLVGELPTPIHHLIFSKDGKFLAATLKDGGGLLVWETTAWREVGRDDKYLGASVNGAAFGPDGFIYTVDYDGLIRRYDSQFILVAKALAGGGRKAHSVSVSPEGDQIIVGFDDSSNVGIYDAKTLRRISVPSTRGIYDRSLRAVAWSTDGSRLYAGSRTFRMDGTNPIISWDISDTGHHEETTVSTDSISQIVPCERGIVVSAADPAFGLLNNDGSKLAWAESFRPDLRDHIGDRFTVSANGKRIRFSLGYRGAQPIIFDLDALTIVDAPEPSADLLPSKIDGLGVQDWKNHLAPNLDDRILQLDTNETSRSLAIAPDSKHFILGAEWNIWGYNAAGDVLWRKPAPNTTWGVNISHDGRLAIAAYADGTIRWHRLSDGQELLALFVHTIDRRFVLWTPKGYFSPSPGAEDFIGWQVNRSWNTAPDFFPISHFRAEFYRPDIVGRVLEDLDEDEAISKANQAINKRTQHENIRKLLPPVISIVNLENDDPVVKTDLNVSYKVRSPSGRPVSRIYVLVDGLPAKATAPVEEISFPSISSNQHLTISVPPRDFRLSLIAETDDGASEPATVQLQWVGPPAPPVSLPTLYALIVGAGDYDIDSYDLKGLFPATDADKLAEQLLKQKGLAFKDVHIILLKDRQNSAENDNSATAKNITAGLQWLANNVQDSRDIALVFFSGHGKTENLTSYLLPVDYDPNNYLSTGLSKELLRGALRGVNGKRVLIIDACYAGRGVLDTTDISNDLSRPEYGIMIFASSGQNERSYADERGSFFTRAFIEGLRGLGRISSIAANKSDITTLELERWTKIRVSDLIRRTDPKLRQRPFLIKPVLWDDDLRLGIIPN